MYNECIKYECRNNKDIMLSFICMNADNIKYVFNNSKNNNVVIFTAVNYLKLKYNILNIEQKNSNNIFKYASKQL